MACIPQIPDSLLLAQANGFASIEPSPSSSRSSFIKTRSLQHGGHGLKKKTRKDVVLMASIIVNNG